MGGRHSDSSNEQHRLSSSHPQLKAARLALFNGQKFIKISVPIMQKDYDIWVDKLLAFQKSTSKLMMPIRHVFTPAGACGEIGSVQVYYPLFPYLLSDEIYDRRGKKRPFSQQELWYLLFSLVKAEHQNMPILGPLGSLSPHNVFLNEEGSIRVPNAISWPGLNSKSDKILDETPVYLSPQEVKTMQEFTKEVQQLQQCGEMFSLGLTMISAGNLSDYKVLYELEKGKFDESKLMEALREWCCNTNYSQVLRGVALNLCSSEPSKRMTVNELWSLLWKHEQSIAKKNNFIIDNAPQKLHQAVQQARKMLYQRPKDAQQFRQKAILQYLLSLNNQNR